MMSELPKTTDVSGTSGANTAGVGTVPSVRTNDVADSLETVEAEAVTVMEETLTLSKREVLTGRVRVSTRTQTHDEVAETTLNHDVVNVTRVPVGQVVEVAPKVRTVGDTTIMPVVEERLVMVKQLFLVEELHIRHRVEHQVVSETVPLRRQHVTIERLDADGRIVSGQE